MSVQPCLWLTDSVRWFAHLPHDKYGQQINSNKMPLNKDTSTFPKVLLLIKVRALLLKTRVRLDLCMLISPSLRYFDGVFAFPAQLCLIAVAWSMGCQM